MKSGIDYFPLDVTLDAKMDLIEAEFGLTGFGVVVHLLQEIYGKSGYYIEWTNEVALLFARKVGLGGSAVSEIVEASIRRGMFDRKLYDKYHVLTSKGIQKRYFEAVSRRKQLEVDYNILLVDATHFPKNVDIKHVPVNIFSKNADISRQSKVEKSKVKKSKVKEDANASSCTEPETVSEPPVILLTLNDNSAYEVSGEQVKEWSALYPSVDIMQQLRNMKGWLDSNPGKRKTRNGILRFITSWLSREQDRRGRRGPAQQRQGSGAPGYDNIFLQMLQEERGDGS